MTLENDRLNKLMVTSKRIFQVQADLKAEIPLGQYMPPLTETELSTLTVAPPPNESPVADASQ
jgi:hypothetical protein